MTTEQYLIGLVGACCAGLGWFANQLYHAVENLKKELGALEVRVGTDFVRYDRLRDMLEPIVSGISEIKTSLSHKVDKP
jgi:hypothetical protein